MSALKKCLYSLEHGLYCDDGVAVCEEVFLGRVDGLLVYHHHAVRQVDTGTQQIVQTETTYI